MAQKSRDETSIKHINNISLSEAHKSHPIIWLDPSIYCAEHGQYRSIEHAMKAYNKEKQRIISCYERQLQRLLAQFSVALKQIEYLEEFRAQQNKQNHLLHDDDYNISTSPRRSSIEIGYESMIEQLNRKIRIMHEEMVNIKNLYITKLDILSQQKSIEINALKEEINKISANTKDMDDDYEEEKTEQIQDIDIDIDISRHFRPQSRSILKDDMNIGKLRKAKQQYETLHSQYQDSQYEIETLKKQIEEENNNRNEEMQIYEDTEGVTQLKKQLKAAQIQQRLLLKQHRNDAMLKAQKSIMMKEQKQIAEEEFKIQLEEVKINKDLVITQLAAEYHSLADKKEEDQHIVEELRHRMNDMAQTHESDIAQLKDEYVSRIHYHRKQIQEYLNKHLEQHKKNNSNIYDDQRRTSEVLHENDIHGRHESEDSVTSHHSREDSIMSQISHASADEIVTSLVIGIDEKLDDILTPGIGPDLGRGFSMIDDPQGIANNIVHNPRDTFMYLDYGITPRDTSTFMNFVDGSLINDVSDTDKGDNGDSDGDDDDDDEPEPEESVSISITETMTVPGLKGGRSNVSLLFAKPLINLITAETSDVVTLLMRTNTHQELAEQCVEYEETVGRYESEIGELRETVDKMVIRDEDQETEKRNLKDKIRKSKRREFDWVTKEREYKSLLAQYRELRENNAKLTLTYFTLQCEYDKLKRDYDEKSAMIMNYGDIQINLANQMPMHLGLNETLSNTSSQHNPLLLSNTSSHDGSLEPLDNPLAMDLLSHSSNEDEVDQVVGFMHHAATPLATAGDTTQHNKQQLSALSSHGYNMSYWGNNVAFQYSAKTKDELIEDILKLREKLSEMTDTKFSILQSTKQEIDRLTSKVKMLEGIGNKKYNPYMVQEINIQEIQLDQQIQINEITYIHKKQRKSFGGGTIGIMSDDHTYTVSRGNDLDTVAKQLASKQHQRAQSMASMGSSTNYLSSTGHSHHDEQEDDNDNDNNNGNQQEDDDENTGHIKSLTVLHNITESDEMKIDKIDTV